MSDKSPKQKSENHPGRSIKEMYPQKILVANDISKTGIVRVGDSKVIRNIEAEFFMKVNASNWDKPIEIKFADVLDFTRDGDLKGAKKNNLINYSRFEAYADQLVKSYIVLPTIKKGKSTTTRISLWNRVENSAASGNGDDNASNGSVWLTLNPVVKNLFIDVTSDPELSPSNAVFDPETKLAYRITKGHSEWDFYSRKGVKSSKTDDLYLCLVPWVKIGYKKFRIEEFWNLVNLITPDGTKKYQGRASKMEKEFLITSIEEINIYTNIYISSYKFIKQGTKITHIEFHLNTNHDQKVKDYTNDPERFKSLLAKQKEENTINKYKPKTLPKYDYEVPIIDYSKFPPEEMEKIKNTAKNYKNRCQLSSEEVDHILCCLIALNKVDKFYSISYEVMTDVITPYKSMRTLIITIFLNLGVRPVNNEWTRILKHISK